MNTIFTAIHCISLITSKIGLFGTVNQGVVGQAHPEAP